MKALKHILTLACLLVFTYAATTAQNRQTYGRRTFTLPSAVDASRYVPGRILVKLNPAYKMYASGSGIQAPGMSPVLSAIGAKRIEKMFPNAQDTDLRFNAQGEALIDITAYYAVDYDPSMNIEEAINLLLTHPAIEVAEPQYIYDVLYNPSDPNTGSQYYLQLIKAYDAWDYSKGDTTIKIGIIDTGISLSHPDLKQNIAKNWNDPIDGIDNDNDGYVDNFYGWDFAGSNWNSPGDNDPSYVGTAPAVDHGVLVSGAASATADNANQIAGPGFNTKLVGLKAAPDATTSIYKGYDAIVYAADHGIQIVNMSWGGTWYSQILQDICTYAAVNKGVLLVAAGGNSANNIQYYPASYKHVISVAASGPNDVIWPYTTRNYTMDVTAPGQNILTTAQNTLIWSGGSGTSLAAPIFCGAAALVLANNPQMTSRQAGEQVRVTADDIYQINPTAEDMLGKGRVNMLRALTVKSPSIRLDTFMLQDNENQIADAWDTLKFSPKWINWLEPTQNLKVNLTSMNPQLVMVQNQQYSVGNIPTMTSKLFQDAFTLIVSSEIAQATDVWLKLEYTDGSYSDFEYIKIRVYPKAVDIAENQVQTSVSAFGKIGYGDHPSNTQGLGFSMHGFNTMIYGGSFLLGTDVTHVSDAISNGYTGEKDFSALRKPKVKYNVPGGWHYTETQYSDKGSYNSLNVSITQRTFADTTASSGNTIIFQYIIRNDSSDTLNGLKAGMFMDWMPGTCVSRVDTQQQVLFVNYNYGYQYNLGVALLNEDRQFHASTVQNTAYNQADKDKFSLMSGNAATAGNVYGDLVQALAGGGITLAPGESDTIAFAMVGSWNAQDIPAHVEEARNRYNCVILNRVPQVPAIITKDICPGEPALVDAGAGYSAYSWNTGETTQIVKLPGAGNYAVNVSNAYGCQAGIPVKVVQQYAPIADFLVPTGVNMMNQFQILDMSIQSDQVSYVFDPGTEIVTPNPYFTYPDPGKYNIMQIATNQYCTDTTIKQIMISSPAVVQLNNLVSVVVWPNPATSQLKVQLNSEEMEYLYAELIDIEGRTLRKIHVSRGEAAETDLTGLQPGMYFLRWQENGELQSERIMITE